MMEELRQLNFQKLITLDYPDIESYTFADYRNNHFKHYPISAYCISCEKRGWDKAVDDPSFQLTHLSHGAHSSDFIESLTLPIELLSGWHDESVMFIYETPSRDHRISNEVNYLNYSKRPTQEWSWIHKDNKQLAFPDKFKRGEYGKFVLSVILTFRLANVYTTHLVKCGMNKENHQFKNISSYNEECVRNCFREFLSYEVNILKPRVIFAVGSAVEKWLRDLVGNSYFIQQLPYPASRCRGFHEEHYKVVYFWLVLRALFKTSVINMDEAKELTEMFLSKFDNP